MTNLNELKPIINLNPFARFCCTIGNLPSSYMTSLTYEEQLLWFCDYLQNTVIPAVNNNAEVVKELQELYVKLKNYVDNYFENLDVQNEINKKLDEMARSGELAEIISQYLQLAGILCYNTINEMKNANNLINGSFVKTFGKNTFNDGLSHFYKIRSLTSSDFIDNENIISLNFSDTLIAEKIINNDYYENIIFIGDSYAVKTETRTLTWVDKMVELINPHHYILKSEGGAGFSVRGSSGHNFKELLDLINPNKFINKIIVCGGYNDLSSNQDAILNGILEFCNIAKNKFPNAKIFIGEIGGNNLYTDNGAQHRDYLKNKVLPSYISGASFNNCIYLNGVEFILNDGSLIGDDGFHPNNEGGKKLGIGIYQAFKNGVCISNILKKPLIASSNKGNYYIGSSHLSNDKTFINFNKFFYNQILQYNQDEYKTINSNTPITIANYNLDNLHPVDNSLSLLVYLRVSNFDNDSYSTHSVNYIPAYLSFAKNGAINIIPMTEKTIHRIYQIEIYGNGCFSSNLC